MFGKSKKGTSASDVGHIKLNTRGTSNEISFSVLDSMKNKADAVEGGVSGAPKPQAWEFSHEEVEAKKRARKRARRFAVLAIIVAAAAVVAGVLGIALANLHAQQDHVQQLKSQISEIESVAKEAAPFIDAVTSALTNSLEAAAGESGAGASAQKQVFEAGLSQLPDIRERLESARTRIQDLQPSLPLASDNEIANQAIDAVNAQMNLLEMGEGFAPAAIAATSSYVDATEVLAQLLEADSKARDAAALMKDPTVKAAEKSIAESEKAEAKLKDVKNAFERIENTLGEAGISVDLTSFKKYAQLRIDAQAQAIDSDNAYIDRDKEKLQETNNAYNGLEQQAATLISKQKEYPSELVEAAFKALCTQTLESWNAEQARLKLDLESLSEYLQ